MLSLRVGTASMLAASRPYRGDPAQNWDAKNAAQDTRDAAQGQFGAYFSLDSAVARHRFSLARREQCRFTGLKPLLPADPAETAAPAEATVTG